MRPERVARGPARARHDPRPRAADGRHRGPAAPAVAAAPTRTRSRSWPAARRRRSGCDLRGRADRACVRRRADAASWSPPRPAGGCCRTSQRSWGPERSPSRPWPDGPPPRSRGGMPWVLCSSRTSRRRNAGSCGQLPFLRHGRTGCTHTLQAHRAPWGRAPRTCEGPESNPSHVEGHSTRRTFVTDTEVQAQHRTPRRPPASPPCCCPNSSSSPSRWASPAPAACARATSSPPSASVSARARRQPPTPSGPAAGPAVSRPPPQRPDDGSRASPSRHPRPPADRASRQRPPDEQGDRSDQRQPPRTATARTRATARTATRPGPQPQRPGRQPRSSGPQPQGPGRQPRASGPQPQDQGGSQRAGPTSNRDDQGDDRGSRRRRGRDRFRDRKDRPRGGASYNDAELEIGENDVLVPVAGILDVMENYAFVRTSGYLPGPQRRVRVAVDGAQERPAQGRRHHRRDQGPAGGRAQGEVHSSRPHRHRQRRPARGGPQPAGVLAS